MASKWSHSHQKRIFILLFYCCSLL